MHYYRHTLNRKSASCYRVGSVDLRGIRITVIMSAFQAEDGSPILLSRSKTKEMLYILEDSPKKIIPLQDYNCGENLISESLNEILHAFDGQYAAAEKIAEAVYENLKYKGKTTIVDISEFELPVTGAYVTVNEDSILKTSAQLENVLQNGNAIMTIYLNKYDRLLEKKDVLNIIASAVVHELTHGGIFLSRYHSEGDPGEDMPEYYENAAKIIEKDEYAGTDVYYFAYALYSTYYHEVQAIISQTIHDVVTILPKDKEPDNESLKKALRQTNSYKAFTNNINIADKLLSAPIEEKLKIANELIKNGVNIVDLDKEAKRVKKVSERALKAISANLMRIYEPFFWNQFKH